MTRDGEYARERRAMYYGKNFEQWSVTELRGRLDALGLSKAERKAELFVRLCRADPGNIRVLNELVGAIMDENNGKRQEHSGEENMAGESNVMRTVNSAELSIQERELELLRRERDLIARELEVLRLENASLRDATRRVVEKEISVPPSESSGSPSVTRSVITPIAQTSVRQKPNVNASC